MRKIWNKWQNTCVYHFFYVILQPKSIYYYVKAQVYIRSGAVFDGKYR